MYQFNRIRLSPLMAAAQQHSKNLQIVAAISLEALDKIKAGTPASSEWVKEKLAALAGFKKVYGEVELAIIPEVEALVTQKLATEPAGYPMF